MVKVIFRKLNKQSLHHKMVDIHTKITHTAQGSTMMGPSLKVAFGHWL